MDLREQSSFPQILLAGALLLTGLTFFMLLQPAYESGALFLSTKWTLVLGLGIVAVFAELGLLVASWTKWRQAALRIFEGSIDLLSRLGKLNLVFFALAIGLFSYLVVGKYYYYMQDMTLRLSSFGLVVLAGSIFLKASGVERRWLELLGASLVFAAMGYRIGAYASEVSTYPFSLGWSETSRYYYASLFFSKSIYGVSVPPSVLHPTRYLMQSLPFLIPDSPLWLHRLWQVLLWIVTTFATAFLLARRLSIEDRLWRWMLVAWSFLFLLLGPVYYHLLVPVILVLWAFDSRTSSTGGLLKNLAVILLASAWAGISRVNWFPVPGMLAASLYFLEQPLGKRNFIVYLWKPAAWTLAGTLVAFGAQALYAVISGNPPGQFTSSLSSDLLWYRLLPNPTYPMGILLGSLVVSLPLLLLVFLRLNGRWNAYHPIRLLGLGAAVGVLYAGGLVVSTKIGGGSNLHNLDAYFTLLLVVSAAIFFQRFNPDRPDETTVTLPYWTLVSVVGLALLVPAYYIVTFGGPYSIPNPEETQTDMAKLKKTIRMTQEESSGDILFISERHLLTFHMVENVSLVDDYEKVFLMEMAMAGNPDYLGRFHQDLKDKRFALIVTEPLFTLQKDSQEIFGEENNAWVANVSEPVLCYYTTQKRLRSIPLQLLIPRSDPQDCP
jgi:hypothetical protein